jgi:hypothetical protein
MRERIQLSEAISEDGERISGRRAYDGMTFRRRLSLTNGLVGSPRDK